MATPRHPFENRYCNGCQCTTRHEVKETTFACLRCGVLKHPTRLIVSAPHRSGIRIGTTWHYSA